MSEVNIASSTQKSTCIGKKLPFLIFLFCMGKRLRIIGHTHSIRMVPAGYTALGSPWEHRVHPGEVPIITGGFDEGTGFG